MGGKAAKERRRLQRLALQESSKQSEHPNQNTRTGIRTGMSTSTPEANNRGRGKPPVRKHNGANQAFPSSNRHFTGSDRNGPRQGGGHVHGVRQAGGRFDERNLLARAPGKPNMRPPIRHFGAFGNARMNRPTPVTKPKKVKKPKHLKRKLEQADGESREKLLNEMKQWEEQKKMKASATSLQQGQFKQQRTSNKMKPAAQNRSQPSASFQTCKESDTTASEPACHLAKKPMEGAKADFEIRASDSTTEAIVNKLSSESLYGIDSESESDVSVNEPVKRQRGRRRRGRRWADNRTNKDDSKSTVDEEPTLELASNPQDSTSPVLPLAEPIESKKASKQDDQRRCIGRKPVTDFIVGQRYNGRVIYMKSFGVFIDIGCHSDAFCHVSRVRDDYIESPSDALTVGDEVSARLVEVDRKQKRLTVSLQSDAKVQDERAAVEAKRQRSESQKHKKKQHTTEVRCEPNEAEQNCRASSFADTKPCAVDESQMTPAGLKRARKLARRAERRAQKEHTGLSA